MSLEDCINISLDLMATELLGDGLASTSISFEILLGCSFDFRCCFCHASFGLEAGTILTETVVIGVGLSQATTEEVGTVVTVRNWGKNREGTGQ